MASQQYDIKELKAGGLMKQKEPDLFSVRLRIVGGYVEANMEMKRKALEACHAPSAGDGKRHAKWRTPSLLQWLEELSRSTIRYVESSSDFVFPETHAAQG